MISSHTSDAIRSHSRQYTRFQVVVYHPIKISWTIWNHPREMWTLVKGGIQVCTISSHTSHQILFIQWDFWSHKWSKWTSTSICRVIWSHPSDPEGRNGVTISGRVLSHSIGGRFDVFTWSYSCSIRFLVDIELSNSLSWSDRQLNKNSATTKTTTSEPGKELPIKQLHLIARFKVKAYWVIRSFNTRKELCRHFHWHDLRSCFRQYFAWFGVLLNKHLSDFMSHRWCCIGSVWFTVIP